MNSLCSTDGVKLFSKQMTLTPWIGQNNQMGGEHFVEDGVYMRLCDCPWVSRSTMKHSEDRLLPPDRKELALLNSFKYVLFGINATEIIIFVSVIVYQSGCEISKHTQRT